MNLEGDDSPNSERNAEFHRAVLRHGLHYVDLATALGPLLEGDPKSAGKRQLDTIHLLSIERENLLQAHETWIERRRDDHLKSLFPVLARLLRLTGQAQTMLELSNKLRRYTESHSSEELKIQALIGLTTAYHRLSAYQLAVKSGTLAVKAAADLAHNELRISALVALSRAHSYRSKESEQLLLRAEDMARELGVHHQLTLHTCLGITYLESGRYMDSRRELSAAFLLLEKCGDLHASAVVLGNLAALELRTERLPEAEKLLRDTIHLARKLSDGYLEATTLSNLGALQAASGKTLEAETTFLASLEKAEVLGATTLKAGLLVNLGMIYCERRDLHSAHRLLVEGLGLVRKQRNRRSEMQFRCCLAIVELLRNRPRSANPHLRRVLILGNRLDSIRETVMACGLVGVAHLRVNLQVAEHLAGRALALEKELTLHFEPSVTELIGTVIAGKSVEGSSSTIAELRDYALSALA